MVSSSLLWSSVLHHFSLLSKASSSNGGAPIGWRKVVVIGLRRVPSIESMQLGPTHDMHNQRHGSSVVHLVSLSRLWLDRYRECTSTPHKMYRNRLAGPPFLALFPHVLVVGSTQRSGTQSCYTTFHCVNGAAPPRKKIAVWFRWEVSSILHYQSLGTTLVPSSVDTPNFHSLLLTSCRVTQKLTKSWQLRGSNGQLMYRRPAPRRLTMTLHHCRNTTYSVKPSVLL